MLGRSKSTRIYDDYNIIPSGHDRIMPVIASSSETHNNTQDPQYNLIYGAILEVMMLNRMITAKELLNATLELLNSQNYQELENHIRYVRKDMEHNGVLEFDPVGYTVRLRAL